VFVTLSEDVYSINVYMYKYGGAITAASFSICTHTQYN